MAGPTALAIADAPTVAIPPRAAVVVATDTDAVAAPVETPPAAVSEADVITWVNRGTSDDVILDRLQHAPNAVHVTAGDEMRLRDAGVDDDVIRALKATAWN